MSRLTLSRELSNDSLSDDKVLQYPSPRFTPKRSRKSRTWSADFWDILPSCQGMLAEWLNGQFAKEAKHSNVPLETIYKLWKLFINHIQKDSFYYEISQGAGSNLLNPGNKKTNKCFGFWVLCLRWVMRLQSHIVHHRHTIRHNFLHCWPGSEPIRQKIGHQVSQSVHSSFVSHMFPDHQHVHPLSCLWHTESSTP